MSSYFRKQHQRWGFGRALHSSLMAVLAKYFGIHIAVLNTRELGTIQETPQVPEDFDIRVLSQADLETAISTPELEITADFAANALAKDGYCGGAFHQDRLVSYVWRAYASTAIHDRLLLCFEQPLRYGYKALTLPDYRGLHLQSAIAIHTDSKDRALGYTKQLSFIETHNYPSLASDKRRGNVLIGYLFWVNNRLFNWAYVSKGARARNISIELL